MTGREPDVNLFDLIEERLLQMKALPQRLGLNSPQRFQDSNMACLDDYSQTAKNNGEKEEDDCQGDKTFKNGIHESCLNSICASIKITRRNAS